MNDARFKELLNLHLDHRLSSAEADELETLLRADPARRKALRDYEAMQSACSALFARSTASAPSSDALRRALRAAEKKIEHPGSLRDAWGWPTWGLTGGLAACVALVVARLSQPSAGLAQAPLEAGGVEQASAAVTLEPVLRPAVAQRAQGPQHLTFAALGFSPNSVNADAASRWILESDEPAVFATLDQALAANDTSPAWRPAASAPVVGSHFSARPISVWAQQPVAGGFQVEPTGFRFER